MLAQFRPAIFSGMLSQDVQLFFRSWTCDPLRVGAIAPSGPALAALMTAEISAASAPVIKLGPGTGVFTRALLARGVVEENLALIEFGSEFAAKLNADFPRAKTLCMDAARLRDVELFDDTLAGAVISGLPLLSMTPRTVYSILEGAFAHLRANGAFYQFTYGPRCPVSRPLLDRLGLKATYLGGTFANVPPAAVYRIQRRKALRVHGTTADRS